MILVDTSVWIDHLRRGNPALAALLQNGQVLAHPWVIGEIALGNLSHRDEILGLLGSLPRAAVATDAEVLALIDGRQMSGHGIGYVDAHLIAATMLSTASRLWTRDKTLAQMATELGIAHDQGRTT